MLMPMESFFLLTSVPGEIAGTAAGGMATAIGALWKALNVERSRNEADKKEFANAQRDTIQAVTSLSHAFDLHQQRQDSKIDEILRRVS